MFSLAIIIPCYNEALRLRTDEFLSYFSQNPDKIFVFVDDGSKDNTATTLTHLKKSSPNNVALITLQTNTGKGNALREGILFTLKNYPTVYISYFDADLSIPFSELMRIYSLALNARADVALGSKIRKIDTVIKRSVFRHVVSRVIATIVDTRFKLGCYDTQCGAKVFRRTVLEKVILNPFYTRWFFDVELLLRIRNEFSPFKALEVPLAFCDTSKNSKLNIFSAFLIVKEIIVLFSKY